jgi:hypothetical protein
MDAVFYLQQGRMTVPLQASRQAELLLVHIRNTITAGLANRHLQKIPHLVLLSKQFYHGELKPLLAKWLVMYLSLRRPSGLTDDQILTYLMLPKDEAVPVSATMAESTSDAEPRPEQDQSAAAAASRAAVCGIRAELLTDESMKLLNLCHEWLHCFFPFILGKIHRVSFGVLSDAEVVAALEADPKMPRTRQVTAVPFMGKDVPSAKSEVSTAAGGRVAIRTCLVCS